MLKALIFDFDGLILDTETPEYEVWQAIYAEHGLHLAPETWGQIVGGAGHSDFDPLDHLEALAGRQLDRGAIQADFKARRNARLALQPVLPGVLATLEAARRKGLAIAIASSSPHAWLDRHLPRLELCETFDAVIAADDVPPGRTKPHPDLFLQALETLHARPDEALLLEDSPNGVQAGKAAGMFVVAIPNPLTARLSLQGADLTLASLAELSLERLMASRGDRLELRPEQPGDLPAIRRVNELAFARPNEAQAVDLIRRRGHASLSLVAVEAGEVLGHILFSPITLEPANDSRQLLGLGPVAVSPAAQRRGIGSRLVRAGLWTCRQQGADAVILVGHPEYYPRFGFKPGRGYGLSSDYGDGEAFMARDLHPGALDGVSGRVHYVPEFEETGC